MSSYIKDGITVIVPIYKCEKFIGKCIESVQKQTYKDWYLILVDDGSPDNAGAICDQYAKDDARIKVLHQMNGGPGKARNNGIQHCETRWFTFLDSDDVIEPDYLSNFHEDELQSDYALSMQGFKRVDMQGNILDEVYELADGVYHGKEGIARSFLDNDVFMYGQSCGKLYNKVLVSQHNTTLSTELKLSEDHLFYMQYLLHVTDVHTHSGTKYCYQMADAEMSLTHRVLPWEETLKRFHEIYRAAEDIVKQYDITNSDLLHKVHYFSVTGAISLTLSSLYKTERNKAERIKVLGILKDDMKECGSKYCPNGMKGKLFKYVLLYMPVSVQDIILSRIIK